MLILQIIFWVSFVALAHTYVVYPLLLKLLASFSSPVAPSSPSRSAMAEQGRGGENSQQPVSILIAAYNEEKVIREKLESIFKSDYPKEKIEVIVGSDASTDNTNEIVRSFPNVQLVEFKGRSGKVKIINHLATLAKHDTLILTDANVMFDKSTIHELTKHFADAKIALVDSNMININQNSKGVAKAESTYIRGEVDLKYNEGKVFGMMMGPFGGCYAVRKNYYSPVPENFLVDDFYINMKVLEKGGKAISELNAKVYEEVPSDWKIEFKRKIRIATGSFQNLYTFFPLLFRFNALSLCFLSHKVLRWTGPCLMIGLYLANFLLSLPSAYIYFELGNSSIWNPFCYHMGMHFHLPFFIFQNFLLTLLTFDLILSSLKLSSPTRFITHFFTTNLALLIGFFKFLGGVRSSIWNPTARG